MLLHLLRHAEAEPYQADDFSRSLREKGSKQARRIGCFMKEQCFRPDVILTSPVLRARQTGEIVAKLLGKADLTEVPWAACGMLPDVALTELSGFAKLDSVLLVGHEPDFSTLIASLIGLARSESIQIAKASLIGVNLPRLQAGSGMLQYLLPVKFL
jgi:phosphohistidine phosphatase